MFAECPCGTCTSSSNKALPVGDPVSGAGNSPTDLVGVETPELEFLLEERPAHVGGVVQLARPVVVEDLSEHARVSVKEVFVEHGVVIG